MDPIKSCYWGGSVSSHAWLDATGPECCSSSYGMCCTAWHTAGMLAQLWNFTQHCHKKGGLESQQVWRASLSLYDAYPFFVVLCTLCSFPPSLLCSFLVLQSGLLPVPVFTAYRFYNYNSCLARGDWPDSMGTHACTTIQPPKNRLANPPWGVYTSEVGSEVYIAVIVSAREVLLLLITPPVVSGTNGVCKSVYEST